MLDHPTHQFVQTSNDFSCRSDLIDESVERRVAAMRAVVDLVRVVRERKSIPVKVGAIASLPLKYLRLVTSAGSGSEILLAI